jgi:hypothetical protein
MFGFTSLIFSSDPDSKEEEPRSKKVYRERINFTSLSDLSFREKFRLNIKRRWNSYWRKLVQSY